MNQYKFFKLALAVICLSLSPALASSFSEIAASATDIGNVGDLPFTRIGALITSSPIYINGEERYVGAYKITLNDNEAIEVSLGNADAEDIDTYLYILDENGEVVAQNDDAGNGTMYVDGDDYDVNSYIKFSGSGVYYILASTFRELTEGYYAIEIKEFVPPAYIASATVIESLPFTQAGQLTTNSPVYEVGGEEKYVKAYKITLDGRTIEISLGGANGIFDPYLYIFDEYGEYVEGDDDSGGDYNSYIRFSGSGVYYILASCVGELETGSYEIEVKEFVPAFIASATNIESLPFTQIGQLTTSSPVYEVGGEEKYVKAYKITLNGGTIEVSLGGDRDTYLYVFDESGEYLVTENDDGGSGTIDVDGDEYDVDSYVRFSGSGVYYILASSFGELTEGFYAIEVKYATVENFSDLIASATNIGSLPFTDIGELTENLPVYIHEDVYRDEDGYIEYSYREKYVKAYRITLTGQTIDILLDGDTDTYLYLLGQNGEIISRDDDGGVAYDANSYIKLSGSGVYYILASSFYELAEGSYTLEVREHDPSPIISSVPPRINSQRAWMQGGTLHLSGLTAGKTWSVYSAKGNLVHRGIASGTEMNVKLNMTSGVYFVRSNGQTLRIVNK